MCKRDSITFIPDLELAQKIEDRLKQLKREINWEIIFLMEEKIKRRISLVFDKQSGNEEMGKLLYFPK